MKKILNIMFLILITGVVCFAPVNQTLSKERKGHVPRLNASIQNNFLQVNNINTVFRSDGIFNYDKITFPSASAGMIWPVASNQRLTVDYSSGIWVGGKVNGELRLAASFFDSHFSPGNIPVVGQVPGSSVCNDPRLKIYQVSLIDGNLVNGGQRTKIAANRQYVVNYDSWASWPVDLGAPYTEVNGIPGYQPDINGGDRPGIGNSEASPDEIIWTVFMDYTNCTGGIHASGLSLPGGSLPLGVEIQMTAFAFLSPGLTDMYFVKWKIINKSNDTWDSVYTAIANDADLGGNADDDAAGCDTANNVGFIYNFDNNDEGGYGAAPPAVGFKYLQSPYVFTGNPNDSTFLPYDTLVGYKALGLTSYNTFFNGGNECQGDPDEDFRAYNFMQGKDGCGVPLTNWVTGAPSKYRYNGNACLRQGWYDSTAEDKRFLQCSGPFTMNSLDTQVIVVGAFVGRGADNLKSVCILLENATRVQTFYNSNFAAIPLPPPPQVSAVADGDGKVTLYWGNISESYNVFDNLGQTGFWKFQGYNLYQVKEGTSGENVSDRVLLATYDVVDSITIVYDTVRVTQPNGTTQMDAVYPSQTGLQAHHQNTGIMVMRV